MIQNFLFKKDLPTSLPKSLKIEVDKVAKTKTKRQAAKLAYKIVTDKYYGHRAETYFNVKKLLQTDVNKIWAESGFYQCTTQNYLIRLLLVKSGKFKDSEVEQKLTLIWYIGPHQYLKVWLDKDNHVYLDPWSKVYRVPFGQRAHGFKSGKMFKS